MIREVNSRTAAENKRMFEKSGGTFRAEERCRRCWLHRASGCTGQRRLGRGEEVDEVKGRGEIVSTDSVIVVVVVVII